MCSTVWNIAGKVAKTQLEPADFFPTLEKIEREPQSPEEQQMIARTIAATLGQTLSRGGPTRSLPA